MGNNGNLRKFEAHYRHGTVFAPKKCACQKKLWRRRAQKYNLCMGAKSPQTCAGLESNRFYEAPYMGDNGNLRKFGATYYQGAVFPPKQCTYQKEAFVNESLKM